MDSPKDKQEQESEDRFNEDVLDQNLCLTRISCSWEWESRTMLCNIETKRQATAVPLQKHKATEIERALIGRKANTAEKKVAGSCHSGSKCAVR